MACDVLLVEDDRATREAIRDVLQDFGLSVQATEEGQTALRLMREVSPHVVLIDLMMPVMNGWQFIETVSASPELRNIPVVMMTASSTPRPAGCQRLLKKPFTHTALESALSPFVGQLPRSGISHPPHGG